MGSYPSLKAGLRELRNGRPDSTQGGLGYGSLLREHSLYRVKKIPASLRSDETARTEMLGSCVGLQSEYVL
jgi:hypothetical protein